MRRLPAHEGAVGKVRGAQVVDAWQQRTIRSPVGADAAHRDAAETHAVVAARSTDKPCTSTVPPRAVESQGDLQRGIHRLGTRIAEEDMIQRPWQERREAACEFERQRMPDLKGREKIGDRRLRLNRLGDLAPAVARIDAPEPRGSIQHRPTVGREIVHLASRREQKRLGFECPIVGERHPERVKIVRPLVRSLHRPATPLCI